MREANELSEKKLVETDVGGSDSIGVKYNLFEKAFKSALVEVGLKNTKLRLMMN